MVLLGASRAIPVFWPLSPSRPMVSYTSELPQSDIGDSPDLCMSLLSGIRRRCLPGLQRARRQHFMASCCRGLFVANVMVRHFSHGWLSKLWSPFRLNTRCRIILRTQEGTIVFTTTHIAVVSYTSSMLEHGIGQLFRPLYCFNCGILKGRSSKGDV